MDGRDLEGVIGELECLTFDMRTKRRSLLGIPSMEGLGVISLGEQKRRN